MPPRVLPISPGTATDGELGALIGDLRAIADAGAEGVLLRERALTDAAFLELAGVARALFSSGWLGIHDRVHVALSVGADAVHLGFKSLRPREARGLAPADVAIGHSHHSSELADEVMAADYRFLGPVHPTPSKMGWLEPLGLTSLAGLPMAGKTWAVGGIGPAEVPAVLDRGVAGVAAIGSIFGQDDVAGGMSAMLEAARAHG